MRFNHSSPLSLFSQPWPSLLASVNEVGLRLAACKECLHKRITPGTYRTCQIKVEKSKSTTNQPDPMPAFGSSASAPRHCPK
jgi:hypothetical protein